MTGHRSDLPQHFNPAAGWRKMTGSRQAAGSRLDARNPAEGSRYAHSAGRIAAEAARRAAGGDQGGFPAAAASRRPRRIVRVVSFPKQKIVAFEGKQQIGKIGPRDGDGPGSAQSRDNDCIFARGRRSAPAPRARGTNRPLLLDRIFDAERNAPTTPPRADISSARRACSRASSACTSTAALILGLTLKICCRWA